MRLDWSPLRAELARWSQNGQTLPVWWRDDDATRPGPQLERLLDLAQATSVPVHLAIIPSGATQDLVDTLTGNRQAVPLVHGWAHANHAPEGQKKAEFGASRALPERIDDARRGLDRLRDLFGATLAPVFVPPWNRVAPDLLPELAPLGYDAISTFTPRHARFAASGLRQINTHIDPIDWRGHRDLRDPEAILADTVAVLQSRRLGGTDATEPLGLLTHHIVHSGAIWEFCLALLSELQHGPVTLFRHARTGQKGAAA